MRPRCAACAAVIAALFVPGSSFAGSVDIKPAFRLGLLRNDNVPLYSQPNKEARILTVLVQQAQVEVLRHRGAWSQVRVWASIRGWIESAAITYRRPWSTVSTYRPPEVHYRVEAHPARAIDAWGKTTAAVALETAAGGHTDDWLGKNVFVRVRAWSQDAEGKIWYKVGRSWALGDAIQFLPTTSTSRSRPGLGRALKVEGKGMWLTLGTVATGDADTVARAAQEDGVTHLYVEAAISPLGFHGRKSVGRLLEAAHRRHITVVAWVYPYLYDLASDVDLTREVSRFRSSGGDRFDGIAADLERNVHLWNIRAYSQLIRWYLGPPYLLVAVPYPPQSAPDFPFAEIARNYDVIAPMDYWHQTRGSTGLDYGHMRYGYDYANRYARDSIVIIQRATGNRVPVAPIGQTFDNFGRLEMGPNAPSGPEIAGFLAGSRDAGALGVSFFQWMTATDAEWRAIRRFHG